MAIVYKDRSTYTQKASVSGTEKIPVSDTECITPSQIREGLYVKPASGIPASDLASGIVQPTYYFVGGTSPDDYAGFRFNNNEIAAAARNYIEFYTGGWLNLKAGKFITAGGSSSQFVKGDGSLDSSTYLTSHQPLAFDNSSVTLVTGSYTLGWTAKHTYVSLSYGSTSLTLAKGTPAAFGYIHYILIKNTGSSTCTVTLPTTNVIAPDSTFDVGAGKCVEISYYYNGTDVVFTFSQELQSI